jgi:isoquinoline 1-oxidoreductase alpha subunit
LSVNADKGMIDQFLPRPLDPTKQCPNVSALNQEGHVAMARTLTINGQAREINAAPDTPLLWVLRDELNLTGAKYGCGVAACGACTVHVDGVPVRACITPLEAVSGAVTTIEGLDPRGEHPVQVAWRKLDVVQCGYCQSGQIMSAAALLATNKSPTDADIDTAMAGNLCRCATYQRVRAAIKDAATQMAGAPTNTQGG